MTEGATIDSRLESFVEAYELDWSKSRRSNLLDYLPSRQDASFLRFAVELIRVDLELSWEAGERVSVADYEQLLPELRSDPKSRASVTYEEFRQRIGNGERLLMDEFAAQRDVDASAWSTIVATSDETATTERFVTAGLPKDGTAWRDFEIVKEIGRGALSRVYLARQTSLSRRDVVLKFAPKHMLEAEKLAKLQHTYIVPVYSVYEDRDFNVFCMPYLGVKTLASAITDGSFSTEDEVLRIAMKLADALDHAHQRGILHNDIKPANILIDDHNDPKLLDFNLAGERNRTRGVTNIGGTIPYMSPESLRGLEAGRLESHHRSDIFSLGAVLFEVATGTQPFVASDNIQAAIQSRLSPTLKTRLQSKTPGFASILAKCLAFDPQDRYQSASALREDLQLHVRNEELRFAPNTSLKERLGKWARRHPRLSSVTTAVSLFAVLAAFGAIAWLAREQYVEELEATTRFSSFQKSVTQLAPELSAIGLDVVDASAVIEQAEHLLDDYTNGGRWRSKPYYRKLHPDVQQQADHSISRLAFLVSAGRVWLSQRGESDGLHLAAAEKWNALSRTASHEPMVAHDLLAARLSIPAGDAADADADDSSKLDCLDTASPDGLQLAALLASRAGQKTAAIRLLKTACEKSGNDYSKWFDLASAHSDLGAWKEAEACLTTCIALRSDSRLAHYLRGRARYETGDHRGAIVDYSYFADASKDHPIALLDRAIARKAAGDYKHALLDLNRVVAAGYAGPRVLIIRSRVHQLGGDIVNANADMRAAMSATPQYDLDFVSRGVAVMARQPKQALDDFVQALTLNPKCHSALRNIAHVLSERLDRSDEAIKYLDDLLHLYPHDAGSIAGRGVLLARSKSFDKAIQDAQRVEVLAGGPRTILQAACIYSLACQERPALQDKALALLSAAFRTDVELANLARNDPDLRGVRQLDKFRELCDAASKLAKAPAIKAISRNDRDVHPR